MEVEYKGQLYTFERAIGLTNEMFKEKCWFIARQQPKNNKQFIEAEKNASIMINMIFLGCKYHKIIEEKINNIIKNDLYFCRYISA